MKYISFKAILLERKKKTIKCIDSAQTRSFAGGTRHFLRRGELASTI